MAVWTVFCEFASSPTPLRLIVRRRGVPEELVDLRFESSGRAAFIQSAEVALEDRRFAARPVRLELEGEQPTRVEDAFLWARTATQPFMPIARLARSAWTSSASSRALPLRLLELGDDALELETLVVLVASPDPWLGGPESGLELELGHAKQTQVWPLPITTRAGVEARIFELPAPKGLSKAAISSLRLRLRGQDSWRPTQLYVFGLGRSEGQGELDRLVPLVALPAGAAEADLRASKALALPLLGELYRAKFRTSPVASIESFYQAYGLSLPETPGNVGVALSGGGSRAMVAGMGQLRGLDQLGVLGKVRALSTVSGGSWLGVPWTYLDSATPMRVFLGPYFPPEALTLSEIDTIDARNLGAQTAKNFTATDIAWRMVDATMSGRVTPSMAWQTVIGEQFLAPYGLADLGPADLDRAGERSSMTFSYDARVLAAIQAENQSHEIHAHLVAEDGRPFLICNMGLVGYQLGHLGQVERREVCPVQSTPFHTGALGDPPITGRFGQAIGGGMVESFAFNGQPRSVSLDSLRLRVRHPWSLVDAAGTSSAFIAAGLVNIIKWILESTDVAALLNEGIVGERRALLERHLESRAEFEQFELPDGLTWPEIANLLIEIVHQYGFVGVLSISTMEPRYHEYSIPPKDHGARVATFVDGGDFDNSGVSALLGYRDIDTIIAFDNSETQTRRSSTSAGIAGHPGTNVVVSSDIAALFGYMPYDEEAGYVQYRDASTKFQVTDNTLMNTQVFEAQQFVETLVALGEVCEGAGPTIVAQDLITVENRYAGVPAGRSVKVVWCSLGPVADWSNALSSEVAPLVEELVRAHAFPNLSTFLTGLGTRTVNLLANLAAWCVCGNTRPGTFRAEDFRALFGGSSNPAE